LRRFCAVAPSRREDEISSSTRSHVARASRREGRLRFRRARRVADRYALPVRVETLTSGEALPRRVDEEAALRAVVEGTASETGRDFYRALVRNLAATLATYGAWIAEFDERADRLRALAFWFREEWIDGFEYPIAGTACEIGIRERRLVHVRDWRETAPLAPPELFRSAGVVSYLGVPLLDGARVMGNVAVVDVRPLEAEPRLVTLFQLFANRARAEMRRLRLEAELRDSREELARLVDSAMDAIVVLGGDLRIARMNPAADQVLRCAGGQFHGSQLEEVLGANATANLRAVAEELERRTAGARHQWIPALLAEPPGCAPFAAEATLSRFEGRGRPGYTLILRDVSERLEAERTIRQLTSQAEYLREELADRQGFGEILGDSPALRDALEGVAQVAATDATVLILGETGTGKELFAQAIHDRSARRDRPLVKVNCAAIPATLIESEFFGHERGAFTGAVQRREGRFALADHGTIFLDEIGELPLELQGKLLRVLQEGEFEPVGAARTRRVDVRVVAATNRDLERAARDGTFREDLYYRLSVFPLRLPPLRERGDDVVQIASALVAKLARAMGKTIAPLGAGDAAALRSYPWPGNVRELRNVVERAIITSRTGRLDLERILPRSERSPAGDAPRAGEVLTERQMRRVERENIVAALERSGWRIAGDGGAAAVLGVSPSTLKSRMKALEVRRPGAP
jgi:transcriptional regulator with GAF, ATPase, and Fis domain